MKISVGTTTKGDPFEGDAISGFVVAQHYGFWLDLMNKGDKPIRLLWPDARYVDEVGKQHTVYHYGQEQPPEDVLTPGPATTVPGGATLKQMIVPGYKTYMVGDCHEQHVFQEPLVPTRLDDKNEQQVKAYVDDLAKWQVPVKLVLPIEVDGVRYDYAFTFVLKDRWADLPKE